MSALRVYDVTVIELESSLSPHGIELVSCLFCLGEKAQTSRDRIVQFNSSEMMLRGLETILSHALENLVNTFCSYK